MRGLLWFSIYRHGANVRANGYENETAVHLAASNGHHDAIRILINHGAEVDAVDENQCTPLMFAGMGSICDFYAYFLFYAFEKKLCYTFEHGSYRIFSRNIFNG